jgi:thermitase
MTLLLPSRTPETMWTWPHQVPLYIRLRGTYTPVSGTSFSAPIVAGVAALIMSANPVLSGAQVQDILMETADDLGPSGWDTGYGWGRVNAEKAVTIALNTSEDIDLAPPIVSIAYPAAGTTVSGTVSVQVNAADNEGIASVNFYVDGSLQKTLTMQPYVITWDTTQVTNGAHTLQVVAFDTTGNVSSASAVVNVNNTTAYIDTIAPSVSIVSPQDGTQVSKFLFVSVNTSDNVGVAKVELYVDSKLSSASANYPFTMKWNTKPASKGAHTLYCKAYDAAGNTGISKTVTVYK